jgi:hypothetical protein
MSSQLLPRATPRIEPGPKFSFILLSCLVGWFLPVALASYWFAYYLAPEAVGPFLRISIFVGAALFGFLWYRAPLSRWEAKLIQVLALASLAWLTASLFAVDRSLAFAGWIKLVVLFAICVFVARGLRHPLTAYWFGIGLLAGGVLLAGLILYVCMSHFGFVLPSFKKARELKGITMQVAPLNPIGFAARFLAIFPVFASFRQSVRSCFSPCRCC